MIPAIHIKWLDGVAKDYVDVFDNGEFLRNGEFNGLWHYVLDPNGQTYGRARFNLKVEDTEALLDYTAFRELNNEAGMEVGETKIEFKNRDDKMISRVFWRNSKEHAFRPANVSCTYPKPQTFPPFEPSPQLKAKKAIRQMKEREGQAEFRELLLKTYGSCCISGCAVEQVLDAAHIDPFQGKEFNHPQNGLLLRKDLHALFDNNLMAIHPGTLKVYFAPEVASDSNYQSLNTGVTLQAPRLCYSSYSPSKTLLECRWNIFSEEHGDVSLVST
ncbi:HNH endonuclease [bacterium]|nr:HNH endonuclease [bacterium]MCI0692036.1 HNH endonuclease [candidate division KSB1 bacterium]